MYLVSTIAGNKSGYRDGKGGDALFNGLRAICMDNAKNLFVADTDNHCIRKITPDGYVSTYAGIPGIFKGKAESIWTLKEQCFYSSDLYIHPSLPLLKFPFYLGF